MEALGTLLRLLTRRLRGQARAGVDDLTGPAFVQRMCRGLAQYRGDLLLLMSGRSILSKEFDELVGGSSAWQRALKAPRRLQRMDFPEADQTFSAMAVRSELNSALLQWMRDGSVPAGAAGASTPAARP